MNSLPQSEMMAVLLNLMGPDAASAALEGVPDATSKQIKATLDEFANHPPTQEEVEYVVDDFVKYFRFAMKTVDQRLQNGEGDSASTEQSEPAILQIAEEDFEVELEPVKKFMPPTLTGEFAQDLTKLHPYQVAHAIRNENTVTISLVIRNLATEHAAKTLEFLPDSLRPAVFLQLAKPSNVSDVILDKVLESTIQTAMRVEQREPIVDTAEQMVTLIRSMPKALRTPMLEELQKTDEELSRQVSSQMYQFDDIALLGDKDLQQILGRTSTESLVLAVQGSDPSN